MLKYFLVLISFFWMCNSIAQTKFYATVSANEIGKEDYVQLKLVVENATAVQKISNPMLTSFSIESGPNEETSVSIVNGKTKKYLALNYIIKPKAVGTFTIPVVIAIADGKEYKTEPITIKVLNKASVKMQTPQSVFDEFDNEEQKTNITDYIIKEGENVANKIKGNMFVKTFVDKKQVYVGEPIDVIYKLYTRLKSESNIVKNPSFNGFSVIDMGQQSSMDYNIEKLNGKEYNVYVLRRAQLYPLQAGQLSIEKIEVENVVTFIKDSYIKKRQDNFFDDFGQSPIPEEAMVNEKVNIESDVLTIDAKPLPSKNVPTLFKGAVGNFTIGVKLKDDKVFTNTANQLIVEVSGKGNLHLINAPETKWPVGFESFEAIVTEDIDKTTLPISGSKTFSFPFVVSDTGKYILDSITFVFFDIKAGQYKKVFTAPINLWVKKGVGKAVAVNNTGNNKVNWVSKISANRKWVIALLAAIITLSIFIWVKKDKKQQTITNNQTTVDVEIEDKPIEIKKDWLQHTKETLTTEDEKLFYKTIHAELVSFLSYKFNINRALINKQSILNAMQQSNIEANVVDEISGTLHLLDDKLYNPYGSNEEHSQIKEVYDRVQNSIEKLS